jgi:hypothetical protein
MKEITVAVFFGALIYLGRVGTVFATLSLSSAAA